jgi:hypothetical protein
MPFTSQSTLAVVAPVTVAVNVFVFAVPELREHGGAGVLHVGEIVTTGGGRIVATEVADNFCSSYETADTLTVAGEGIWAGARYRPFESILPTVSFPPVTSFTFQVTMLFVPPETLFRNCVFVATFRETAAGAIETVIPVTGSVHDEKEEVVEVVVVHVMAVLGVGAVWRHETRLNTPMSNAKTGRRLTAPLSLPSPMPIHFGSVATPLQKSADYISSCLLESLFPVGSAIPNGWGSFNKQAHSSAKRRWGPTFP